VIGLGTGFGLSAHSVVAMVPFVCLSLSDK